MKNYLYIINRPPYGGSQSIDQLDCALVAAAFDGAVSLLFCGDGVWNLLPEQDGSQLGQKTVSKLLKALPTYDIDNLYVCDASLAARGLDLLNLGLEGPWASISMIEQSNLIREQDVVVGA